MGTKSLKNAKSEGSLVSLETSYCTYLISNTGSDVSSQAPLEELFNNGKHVQFF